MKIPSNLSIIQIENPGWTTWPGVSTPDLYVPFTDAGAGIAVSNYTLGSGAQPTHTRATAAWTRLANGLWTSVAAGNLRSYYNEDGVYCGALFEPAETNIAKWNRDLTNPVWVQTGSPTVAKDGTGMDGVANSCSTITCGAAGDTVIQLVVSASVIRQGSFWLKRLIGSGSVEITIDNGATWTDVNSALSTVHFRCVSAPIQTLTNINIGIRMWTVGDKIAVDMSHLVLAANGSYNYIPTPIETNAVNVARNADVLGNYDAANISDTEGTVFAECSTLYATSGNTRIVVHLANGGAAGCMQMQAVHPAALIGINDGTGPTHSYNANYIMENTPQECATSWGVASGLKYACYKGSMKNNAGINSYSTFDGSIGVNDGVFVSRGTNLLRGCVKNLRIWKTQLPVAVMQGLTI